MNTHILTLLQNVQVTHNVHELIYTSEQSLWDIPGQFLLCDCDENDMTKKRAYSIAWSRFNEAISQYEYGFIIKALQDGTWGSKKICAQEVGHGMEVSSPLGDFILQSYAWAKLFIWTGTWFAPLWFQLKQVLESWNTDRLMFVFGVRHKEDVFYVSRLSALQEMFPNLEVIYCLSQDTVWGYYEGYVTDHIQQELIEGMWFLNKWAHENEVSICGSPSMVRDVRKNLSELWVSEGCIRYEQY